MYQTKLGHVHLKVRNLQRSIEFYTRLLPLRVTETVQDRFAFLSSGPLHHELALQALGDDAPLASHYSTGLFHVAFEVPDKSSFAQAYVTLREANIQVYLVDYGISWAMYFADPDQNGLEIYVDTRNEPDGRPLWKGESRPLDPQTVLSALKSDTPE